MGVVRVDVQIEAIETQLEVSVSQGLRMFMEEEEGKKEEYEGKYQKEEASTQGHLIFVGIQAGKGQDTEF